MYKIFMNTSFGFQTNYSRILILIKKECHCRDTPHNVMDNNPTCMVLYRQHHNMSIYKYADYNIPRLSHSHGTRTCT